MKRSQLPPSVKGMAQLAGLACEIMQQKSWLQLMQVEPRFQTLKMTSYLYFQNGLFKVIELTEADLVPLIKAFL